MQIIGDFSSLKLIFETVLSECSKFCLPKMETKFLAIVQRWRYDAKNLSYSSVLSFLTRNTNGNTGKK